MNKALCNQGLLEKFVTKGGWMTQRLCIRLQEGLDGLKYNHQILILPPTADALKSSGGFIVIANCRHI